MHIPRNLILYIGRKHVVNPVCPFSFFYFKMSPNPSSCFLFCLSSYTKFQKKIQRSCAHARYRMVGVQFYTYFQKFILRFNTTLNYSLNLWILVRNFLDLSIVAKPHFVDDTYILMQINPLLFCFVFAKLNLMIYVIDS